MDIGKFDTAPDQERFDCFFCSLLGMKTEVFEVNPLFVGFSQE
jgi:hypothetical protein